MLAAYDFIRRTQKSVEVCDSLDIDHVELGEQVLITLTVRCV